MDETAIDFVTYEDGTCNYCKDFLMRVDRFNLAKGISKTDRINDLKTEIQAKSNKKSKYDCIVGVSGGVDSCWVLAKAIEIGLNPLAVHMDNGWNSEIAQNNIANLITKSGVDLYTYVIDWEEYRDMMDAFFKADVIDIEMLYDNAAIGVLSKAARKFGINFILSGMNLNTEGVAVPENWKWNKLDAKNIKSIVKSHSAIKIRSFPLIGILDQLYNEYILGIKTINLLDYIEYDILNAKTYLQENYDFKPYLYKHYESVFTRFYQGHILPRKFMIDKRKPHLSSLIMSKTLTRKEAILLLENSTYGDEFQRKVDIRYFLKKMGWDHQDLNEYLARPEQSHAKYQSSIWFYDLLKRIYKKIYSN